jgi:L-rhamnose mutarotase
MSPAFSRIRVSAFAAVLVLAALISVAAEKSAGKRPQRYGSVIGLRAEKLAEYKKMHAAIWPEVAKAIRQANIRNYSIFLRKLDNGNYYLFAYFEYVGDDFRGDMALMGQNPNVKKWWTFTDPCQKPLADRAPGQWWASMEEVFHQD